MQLDIRLILKKIQGKLTPKENVRFDRWYSESESHRAYFEKVRSEMEGSADEDIDPEEAWETLSPKLVAIKEANPGRLRFWWWAAALVVAVASYTFYHTFTDTDIPEAIVISRPKTISIGTDKATLVLGDGSEVALEKGATHDSNTHKSDGKSLIYNRVQQDNANLSFNTLRIPRGGQFFVQLSDGTKVWLNSDTQLRYPVNFVKGGDRRVELIQGEAFFEVVSSHASGYGAFHVQHKEQDISVLGTQFNIKAYADEQEVATTLAEGKLKVSVSGNQELLLPGNQVVWQGDTLQQSPVDVYGHISWKEGMFSFKDKSLSDIFKVLARWYDIEVDFQNQVAADTEFNGLFKKHQKIHDILTLMEGSGIATFTIEGNTVTIQ
jgi:ferric-dicitrate binding protein FerR (iron transport regulator)